MQLCNRQGTSSHYQKSYWILASVFYFQPIVSSILLSTNLLYPTLLFLILLVAQRPIGRAILSKKKLKSTQIQSELNKQKFALPVLFI